MLEEGVPARQVLRLMAATALSRLEMQRVTGLSAEQLDQQLAGDRPFSGAPGKALFSLIDLMNATEVPVESTADVDAGSERLVGRRVRDWLAAEAANGPTQEAGRAR